MPSDSVLDKEEAFALCSGDEELFLELSAVFLLDATRLIERLKQALESGDSDGVAMHAHAVKGISANICAGPLEESAGRLEIAGRNKESNQLAPLFEEFHLEFLRLQKYLIKIIPLILIEPLFS